MGNDVESTTAMIDYSTFVFSAVSVLDLASSLLSADIRNTQQERSRLFPLAELIYVL